MAIALFGKAINAILTFILLCAASVLIFYPRENGSHLWKLKSEQLGNHTTKADVRDVGPEEQESIATLPGILIADSTNKTDFDHSESLTSVPSLSPSVAGSLSREKPTTSWCVISRNSTPTTNDGRYVYALRGERDAVSMLFFHCAQYFSSIPNQQYGIWVLDGIKPPRHFSREVIDFVEWKEERQNEYPDEPYYEYVFEPNAWQSADISQFSSARNQALLEKLSEKGSLPGSDAKELHVLIVKRANDRRITNVLALKDSILTESKYPTTVSIRSFDDTTFAEQVHWLNSQHIILVPAFDEILTNTMFLEPNTTVIHLYPKGYCDDSTHDDGYYESLVAAVGGVNQDWSYDGQPASCLNATTATPVDEKKKLISKVDWIEISVPDLVNAVLSAASLYFDTTGKITKPRWPLPEDENNKTVAWCVLADSSSWPGVQSWGWSKSVAHSAEALLPCIRYFSTNTNATTECGYWFVDNLEISGTHPWAAEMMKLTDCRIHHSEYINRTHFAIPDGPYYTHQFEEEYWFEGSSDVFRDLVLGPKQDLDHDRLHVGIVRRNKDRKIRQIDDLYNALMASLPANTIITMQHFDDMTLAEQAYWFNCQHIVIATHGAALTNSVFLEQSSSVVHLYPFRYYFKGYFESLVLKTDSFNFEFYDGDVAKAPTDVHKQKDRCTRKRTEFINISVPILVDTVMNASARYFDETGTLTMPRRMPMPSESATTGDRSRERRRRTLVEAFESLGHNIINFDFENMEWLDCRDGKCIES